MSTIRTREFVIDDYEKAVTLWNLVEGVEVAEGDSKEEIRAYLLRNPGLSRVAEESGAIIGAVLCGHDGRRGLIYHLAVAPAHHGKGIGKTYRGRMCRATAHRGHRPSADPRRARQCRRTFVLAPDRLEDVPGALLMGIDL